MSIAQDVLKGNDMKTSLQDEVNDLKASLSSVMTELRKNCKRSSKPQEGSGIMRKSLKKTKRRSIKKRKRNTDFFQK